MHAQPFSMVAGIVQGVAWLAEEGTQSVGPLNCASCRHFRRLHEVIHIEKKLYLVFEFVELDLKKVMDSNPCFSADQPLIKVRFAS